jgi:hypothetical protein
MAPSIFSFQSPAEFAQYGEGLARSAVKARINSSGQVADFAGQVREKGLQIGCSGSDGSGRSPVRQLIDQLDVIR